MNSNELIVVLQKLPRDITIFTRQGRGHSDDMFDVTVRVFKDGNGKLIAVIVPTGEHANFPEGYTGVEEITDRYFKE